MSKSQLIWMGTGSLAVWTLILFPVSAQPIAPQFSQAQPSTSAVSSELCASQNSLPQDEQIILGELPDAPYVVVVPGQGEERLAAVRQCIPDAFQTNSRLGSYIRAGAFSDRRSAAQLSRYLRRSLNVAARVMYLP